MSGGAQAAVSGLNHRTGAGTRELILQRAEQLYAEYGIAAVSNRRVAEAAGAANHFSVGYHFGTKTDLVRAIVRCHQIEADEIRRGMLRDAPPGGEPRDLVRRLVLPTVRHLAELPAPTWCARFTVHAMTDPAWRVVVEEEARAMPGVNEAWEALLGAVPAPERRVLEFRGGLVGILIAGACARYEQQLAEGSQAPGTSWHGVGEFIVDAVTGMLLAPQTSPLPKRQAR